MRTDIWANVITRISPLEPTNLDGLLDEVHPRKNAPGALSFQEDAADHPLALDYEDPETVCFGARITPHTPNPLNLAMTLAQMADEKAATPIILSHLDHCGLERFGFRVERIVGGTPDEVAACEAQICDFWNIVLVI